MSKISTLFYAMNDFEELGTDFINLDDLMNLGTDETEFEEVYAFLDQAQATPRDEIVLAVLEQAKAKE